MKPKSTLRSFLALASSVALAAPLVNAANIYWDGGSVDILTAGTGTSAGGNGTWNTTILNWDSGPGAHVAWANLNLDTAIFGGTVGTVTLGTGITVGGLRFDTTGYVINAGSSGLTFGATTNTILFNNGIAAATITGTVTGAANKDVVLSNAANHASQFLGTLTLNGTSTGGWSGSTTINSGMTLALAGSNQGLLNTSGITLNGGFTNVSFQATQTGGILLTNTSAPEALLNRVSDSAVITSNGGFITVTNSGATTYSETMGALDLRRGQLNVTQTNSSGTQTLTFGSGSLTTVNGSARTNVTTSAINFSGTSLGAGVGNTIKITGQADTAQNAIIAPWATYGGGDYAVYNRAGSANASTNSLGIQGAAITASAQSTWGTIYAATNNYTLTNAVGTATQLTATRSINTLRSTGGTSQNIASITSNVLTVTGSAYADGDVVVTGADSAKVPTGLTRDTAYYVVNASGTTFQLAATPGGAAITGLAHVASSPLTGGIRLSSGNNLETYGILNNSTVPLGIGGATGAGVLTTPTGGGNLYLTIGNSGYTVINAPITDNGGAVTVVKSGGGKGMLVLSGNNTFTGGLVVNAGGSNNGVRLVGTQSFTGGITLNGGGLGDNNVNGVPSLTAASLNGNAITVNGPSHLMISDNQTLATSSTITINATGVLNLGGMGTTGVFVPGVVSGSGVLNVDANNANNATNTVSLTNSANTFYGNVTYTTGNGTSILNVNSIGDSSKVVFGLGGTSATFALNTGAAAMTLSTRQFEMAGAGGGTNKISNNSANAFLISTDLLATGTGNRTLTLGGTGAGLGTFGGKLIDGSLTSLAISKADAGTWTLTNTGNTYTGGTSVAAGTLSLGASDALGSGAVTVTGGTLQLGTFSDTVGMVAISGGTIDGSTGVLSGSRVNATGASTISAILGGSGSLNKFVSATSTSLTKANTYSGGTNVYSGTLAVGASGTLGQNVSGNGININEQGILTLAAVGNSGSNQAITLTSSSSTDGRIGNLAVLGLGFNGLPAGAISQANTVGGVIALNGVTGYNTDLSTLLTGKNLFLGSIGTSTFTGAASTVAAGNGALYRLGGGGGQITFNTTNMFTSTNGVQVGSFLTNGGGTVVISESQNYSGATTINAGTLTLSGAGALASSTAINLNGGSLTLHNTSGASNLGNRVSDSAVITVNGNPALNFTNSAVAADYSETIGTLSLQSGSFTYTGGQAASGRTSNLLFTNLTRSGASNTSTVNFTGTSLGADARNTIKFTNGVTGGQDLGPWAVVNGGAFATYDATFGIKAATSSALAVNSNSATTNFDTTGGSITFNSGLTPSLKTLLVTGSTARTTALNGNTVSVGGISSTGATHIISGAGAVQALTAGDTLYINVGANTLQFDSVIQNVGAGATASAVVKSGTGTLTLSAANTFTGGFVINTAGVLNANNNSAFGTGPVTVNATTNMTPASVNYTYANSFALNNGAMLNFTISGGNTNTISGAVTGTGGVGPSGAGSAEQRTISLTNTANTFTGPIMLNWDAQNHSALSVNSLSDAVGSGAINLFSNASASFIWGAGAVTPLTLNNRQFVMTSSTAGANLFIKNANTTAANIITVNTDLLITGGGTKSLTLRGANTGNNNFAGKIGDGPSGALSLTKDEAGTWSVTNTANTYTGTTTVSAGTLGFANGALGSTGTINASGGTLLWLAGNTQDISGRLAMTTGTTSTFNTNGNNVAFANAIGSSTTGALTKTGLGTLTLGGSNTYTGNTDINAGTLQLQSAASTITQTLGALRNQGGEGTLVSNKSGLGDISTTFNGTYARAAGATGNIVSTGGTNGSTNVVNMNGALGFIDKGLYFGGSEFAARHALNGYVRALAYGSDTDAVAVNTITAARHVKLNTTPGSQAAVSLLSLNLSGGGVSWTTTSGNLTVPGIIKSGGGSQSTISGGSLTTAGNAELVIRTDVASDSLNVTSQVTGFSGGLTKSGAGTLTLSHATNGYTGNTSVNAGKLVVNGSISTSPLTTVQIGATLGGTGTVGAATINGSLAPGNSIGTLNAQGDVTWNDNDAWVFELGSAASTLALANSLPSNNDLLNITGAGNDFLKGNTTDNLFTFNFAGTGATGWYKLVDWTSTTTFVAGDFNTLNLGTGLTGSFTVDSDTSALYLNVVPEPNVAALLGGLGTLMLLRRRRS